jgi:hypothetical protein
LRPSACCKSGAEQKLIDYWVRGKLSPRNNLYSQAQMRLAFILSLSTQTKMISSRMSSVMHDGSLASDF